MSEDKSENKIVLPLPFLLESSSTTTNLSPRQNNSFRFGNSDSMEDSFEHFDFANPPPAIHLKDQRPQHTKLPSPPLQLQHRSSHAQQQVEPIIESSSNNINRRRINQRKRQTSTQNYKLYDGKTIFFCGGRFMASREFWAFCLSLFLLVMPSVLFLIFTCPWLWHHISPAVPVLFAYIFCIALASMLKTSWTDPGIIPRNLDVKSLNSQKEPDRFGYRYSSMSDSSFPLPKEVIIKGVSIRLKYCETCCIYRPPRASHCKQCDNCVGSGLTGYHCFLVMRGVTTHEQLRSNLSSMPIEENPYNFGNPLKNMYHILCRPHNKSYIARRKFAEEIYDIQPNNSTNSNLSTTIRDEFGQISTLDATAASNISLQNR
ncbi:hypothetical protein INT46_004468 [Mucor plumbeus]|uniref:protein S-acyltransferase n=1 Tax=Mucor plumbeus TaxID=97098 RepID=A0A8H7QR26_9FUNG|nr:hypothetical protein INT46_004468 [Mucor plumbeus]